MLRSQSRRCWKSVGSDCLQVPDGAQSWGPAGACPACLIPYPWRVNALLPQL